MLLHKSNGSVLAAVKSAHGAGCQILPLRPQFVDREIVLSHILGGDKTLLLAPGQFTVK